MQSSRRRLRSGLAFLIAAAGLGLCGYAGLLWRELPHYSEADISASAELNLSLDLAREQKSAAQLDAAALESRRRSTVAEVRADIASERQPMHSWLVAGLTLLAFAALQMWLTRGLPR